VTSRRLLRPVQASSITKPDDGSRWMKDVLEAAAQAGAIVGAMTDSSRIPDRVRALALDILHRIRPVCAHMPDEELLALATQMASVELRHFERTAGESPVRRVANGG
jgi:hypothetical protein